MGKIDVLKVNTSGAHGVICLLGGVVFFAFMKIENA